MTDKYKTVEKEIGIKESKDKTKKYKIKVLGKELTIEKDKYKGEDPKTDVSLEVVEIDKDGNEVANSKKNPVVKGCAIKRGTLSDSIEIPANLGDSTILELEGGFQTPVEGWNMIFHIGWAVLAVLIVGALVWWYIASRKEDKEEESL